MSSLYVSTDIPPLSLLPLSPSSAVPARLKLRHAPWGLACWRGWTWTQEQFLKSSNTLYTCFRSNRLAGSARAPFLRQLLLRLNYNNFYSDEAARRLLMRMVRVRVWAVVVSKAASSIMCVLPAN